MKTLYRCLRQGHTGRNGLLGLGDDDDDDDDDDMKKLEHPYSADHHDSPDVSSEESF